MTQGGNEVDDYHLFYQLVGQLESAFRSLVPNNPFTPPRIVSIRIVSGDSSHVRLVDEDTINCFYHRRELEIRGVKL